ncbi:MAG TPA: hypothetical protein VFB96_25060, partial [Pirellulaceae bacterium]|nr:hypothetical protein [Pirellulaceae bacterium]
MTEPRATAPRWGGLFRFSLRQLLLATAFVAIGCYALRWASPWWAIVLFYAGLTLIVVGILIAINRRGESRSFWAGFAMCGLAHMLLVFRPGLPNGIPSLFPAAFVTTWASAWTYHQVESQLTVNPRIVSVDELIKIRGRPGGDFENVPLADGAILDYSLKSGEDGSFSAIVPAPQHIMEKDFIEVAHGL